jgi:hypothetical protein
MVKFAAVEGGGTTWVAVIAVDNPGIILYYSIAFYFF